VWSRATSPPAWWRWARPAASYGSSERTRAGRPRLRTD
jgi:hypothetical protein